MKNPFSIFILLIFLACKSGLAQPPKKKTPPTGDAKIAEEYFKSGNFEGALDEYLVLVKKEPNNEKYNYRIGVCYLNTDIDKTKAIPYFEKIRNSTEEPEINYLLGRAYHYAYKFDDAIKQFSEYKKLEKGKNLSDVELQVQYCINAKEIIKYPLNVSFENLGKYINSEYSDYFPFVPADESFLIFNSKRPEAGAWQKLDGSWEARIYFSKVKNGEYSKAKPMGRIINDQFGEEEAIGLSASGEYLLVYYDNYAGAGDIYISKGDKSRNFKQPMMLDENINSARGHEIAASITADGNAIYFASLRAGGKGGSDIYVCRRLPTGNWSPAQNLEEINTAQNEDFPNISPDGNTLYFSSMGHTSMGGYDIFYARWDEKENRFRNVKNLGYPLNTPEDDMNFRISASGKYGYISARKQGGYGDLDIYRADFQDVDPEYTVLTGIVRSADASKPVDSVNVFIAVTDAKSGEQIGSYMPNPSSGRYVIILPPGKFILNTEIPGYTPYNEKIEIFGKSSFKPLVEKNIILLPEGYSPPKKK